MMVLQWLVFMFTLLTAGLYVHECAVDVDRRKPKLTLYAKVTSFQIRRIRNNVFQ